MPSPSSPRASDVAASSALRLVDSGSFTHYLRGARVGEERFVIREERTGGEGTLLLAAAEVNRKIDGETSRIRVALEAIGTGPLPVRYEVAIHGSDARTIVAVLVRDRLRLNVRSSVGHEMRQFLVQGSAIILDRHMAHQYFFASRVLGEEETAETTVFVPQNQNQAQAVIRDLGLEDVAIEGESYRLRHLSISADEIGTQHAWLDGETVVRVEVPREEWSAVRSDLSTLSVEEKGESPNE